MTKNQHSSVTPPPNAPPPIAITMGEPAGIGIDLLLMLLDNDPSLFKNCVYIGDPDHLKQRASRLKLQPALSILETLDQCDPLNAHALQILPLRHKITPDCCGLLDQNNNPAILEAIETSVALAMQQKISAMVTLPIHKAILMETGFAHKGHTDFIGKLSGAAHPIMMLATHGIDPVLRVVPLSVHVPLKAVLDDLKKKDLYRITQIIAQSLHQYFGIDQPVLAFAGINPHAGEEGRLGSEEQDMLRPLLKKLNANGIHALGPFSADSLFHDQARMHYDAVLCAYHDQALIPLKTLDFYGGVNITFGLPFIRTSPDHGTALTLAGTGKGNATSLLQALMMARQMHDQSRIFTENQARP